MLDYVNLRAKLNCKQRRSVTVSDQKGLITRGKTQTSGSYSRAQIVCFQRVSPLRTQDAFTCDVTRLPLFLTSASVAAGVEESRVGAMRGWRGVGRWAPGSGLTEERLTQPQPLRSTTLCLQDNMQPSAGSPPPPPPLPPPPPPHPRPSTHFPIRMLLKPLTTQQAN